MRAVLPRALRSPNVLSIAGLLRPHWIPMTLALVGVAGEAAASLLEPWPLKIVLDYLLQSRPLPGWMMPVGGWIGGGSLAVLNFAVVAVAVIAVAGAISSYANTDLTTNVGQWVMHDLRRTLYHHIHRLSLAEHDEKRTGDLIGRVTSDIESIQDFITSALLGIVTNVLTLVGHHRRHALPELALHADLALRRAGAVPGGVLLHAADQEGLARRPEEGERAGVDRRRGLLVDSRRQGVRARGLRGAAVRAPEPRERRGRPAWREASR